jgi:hypothetical protein
MVQLIQEKKEAKFLKLVENALKLQPNAEVHYSVSQGTGLGGSASVIYTALIVERK